MWTWSWPSATAHVPDQTFDHHLLARRRRSQPLFPSSRAVCICTDATRSMAGTSLPHSAAGRLQHCTSSTSRGRCAPSAGASPCCSVRCGLAALPSPWVLQGLQPALAPRSSRMHRRALDCGPEAASRVSNSRTAGAAPAAAVAAQQQADDEHDHNNGNIAEEGRSCEPADASYAPSTSSSGAARAATVVARRAGPKKRHRLDEYCLLQHPQYSRNIVQSWILQGKVGGRIVIDASVEGGRSGGGADGDWARQASCPYKLACVTLHSCCWLAA